MASPMRMRGSSDANGSWKIICTRVVVLRGLGPITGSPSIRATPVVGAECRRSCDRGSICHIRIHRRAPAPRRCRSRARHGPPRVRRAFRCGTEPGRDRSPNVRRGREVIGSIASWTSTKRSCLPPIRADDGIGTPARPARQRAAATRCRRHRRAGNAARTGSPVAGSTATAWHRGSAPNPHRAAHWPAVTAAVPGVGMARRPQHRRRRPLLDQPAGVHHQDPAGDRRHGREVVADPDERGAGPRARPRISVRICAWIDTSSAVVGSSQTISAGRLSSAMAMATRWRMPPEN